MQRDMFNPLNGHSLRISQDGPLLEGVAVSTSVIESSVN